jgi:hypothetical protein
VHTTGQESWQIREDRWIQHFEWALWIRAAERIDVPAGGIVPGPLLIDPLPAPSQGLDSATLSEQWLSWWQTLCGLPEFSPAGGGPPPMFAHSGPDFDGLDRQPLLRELLRRRWPEAHHWHSERKRAGVHDRAFARGAPASSVVSEVERANGRKARPFVLAIDVLPVDDLEVRAINDARFLVPEGVRDGASWPHVLRGLIEPLA